MNFLLLNLIFGLQFLNIAGPNKFMGTIFIYLRTGFYSILILILNGGQIGFVIVIKLWFWLSFFVGLNALVWAWPRLPFFAHVSRRIWSIDFLKRHLVHLEFSDQLLSWNDLTAQELAGSVAAHALCVDAAWFSRRIFYTCLLFFMLYCSELWRCWSNSRTYSKLTLPQPYNRPFFRRLLLSILDKELLKVIWLHNISLKPLTNLHIPEVFAGLIFFMHWVQVRVWLHYWGLCVLLVTFICLRGDIVREVRLLCYLWLVVEWLFHVA